jgi:hypothetical protein
LIQQLVEDWNRPEGVIRKAENDESEEEKTTYRVRDYDMKYSFGQYT